jgi:transposase-like protein
LFNLWANIVSQVAQPLPDPHDERMQHDGVTPAPSADAAPAPGGAPDGDLLRLTVSAAARRLGVAPSTLRTWDRRYGIGPSEHESGRHRRYAPADVARLELMQSALLRGASPAEAARFALSARLPPPSAVDGVAAAPAAGDGRAVDDGSTDDGSTDDDAVDGTVHEAAAAAGAVPEESAAGDGGPAGRVRVGGRVLRLPGAGREARGLGRAALALDGPAVRTLLTGAVAAHGVGGAWDDVVRPVLSAVAQRWAETGAGIEIEHLLSECVVGVFGAHSASAPALRTQRPVLLAAMPDEMHALPLAVLAAALADHGVEARSLGARLPADALATAIRRTAPSAVVLWSQTERTADAEVLGSLPHTRPRYRTFTAGPGWATAVLPPRTGRLGSLDEAVQELVAAVLPGPVPR